jgi:hypothetical protein
MDADGSAGVGICCCCAGGASSGGIGKRSGKLFLEISDEGGGERVEADKDMG